MRNKPKNIRMELEVTLDVETLSYMKFSLTLHSKIKKYWEREKYTVNCVKFTVSCQLTLKSPLNICQTEQSQTEGQVLKTSSKK